MLHNGIHMDLDGNEDYTIHVPYHMPGLHSLLRPDAIQVAALLCPCARKASHQVAREEAEGVAVCRQPPRPADPVDVRLKPRGEVVVHNVRQSADVQASRSNVGRNHDLQHGREQ